MALVGFLAAVPTARASAGSTEEVAAANPIRKVVTLLQAMQKRVAEEGEKEEALYKKYVCYCSKGESELSAAIASANTKLPQLASDIESSKEKKTQLEEDLKQHKEDRTSAKAAMASATEMREKEAKEFAAEKADLDANIVAIKKAVTALEKGMSGGFLQTTAANMLKKLVSTRDMNDADRQTVMAFLSGSSDYAPASGEVTGILKSMGDEMLKSLNEATDAENAAIKTYQELMAAKKKEVNALTESIETKTQRVGQLAVEIVQMENDLTDTQAQLVEDQKFIADLQKNCATKADDWAARQKMRAEELVAIAETIKILNDDDALELFKKTLPAPSSASASFAQLNGGDSSMRRAKALQLIRAVQKKHPKGDLDFVALAIQGKKFGLEKVIKMIDDMVVTLKAEQGDDDNKVEYCGKQLDEADDKKKDLEQKISDLETAMATTEDSIATAKDEIAALGKSIKDLDKQVAEATEQRKAEHEEFSSLMSSNTAAKDLLGIAKNRLNKFYNPKLYKPPASAASFVQVFQHVVREAPAPPPETWDAYSKKSQENTGVIAMIDLLIKDLDKEMVEAETEEENNQKEYEELMKDSAEKRATASKQLTDKTSAKASMEADLQQAKEQHKSSGKELMATAKFISSLHAECDWLMKYYDVRKEARSSEIDALKNAKAVLSGADFSLVQTGLRR
jgi:chromosome segregation ATPase